MVAELFLYKWASYRGFTVAKIIHLIAEIAGIQKFDPYIYWSKDTQFSEDESSQQFIGQRFGIKPFSSPNIQLNKMASEHVLNTDKVPKRNH